MPSLSNALLITVIGMGLVFVAILALWGLMELMVRLTGRSAKAEEATEAQESEEMFVAQPETADALSGLKQKAAAAAVALALACEIEEKTGVALQATYSSGNAWQTISRGGQLSQRANLYSRKSRGK